MSAPFKMQVRLQTEGKAAEDALGVAPTILLHYPDLS
jgi:hypothetical protein